MNDLKLSSGKGKIFIIEGLIAVGKSSFVRATIEHAAELFGADVKVAVIVEQVYLPLLDLMINKPKQWAMPFQAIMARDRIDTMRRATELYNQGFVVLIDRGLPGDLTFARVQQAMGNIDDAQMRIYFELVAHGMPRFIPLRLSGLLELPSLGENDTLISSNVPLPHHDPVDAADCVIVYFSSDAKVSFERMRGRGVKSETGGYTIEYFETLKSHYDTVIGAFGREWGTERVVEIDYNGAAGMSADRKLPLDACAETWRKILGKQ